MDWNRLDNAGLVLNRQEIAGYGYKWLEMAEMNGNEWTGLEWLEMVGFVGSGQKWLEGLKMAKITGNGWTWLEMADKCLKIADKAGNVLKWLKLLEMAGN